MNPADSGRDSTGRPRSVEDVEEINRLRAENRNLSAAFLASLAKRRETAGQAGRDDRSPGPDLRRRWRTCWRAGR